MFGLRCGIVLAMGTTRDLPWTRRKARAVYARTFEALFWPAWERTIRGRDTVRHVRELELSQWRAPEQLQQMKMRSLRELLSFAGTHIPYYRDLFREHHIRVDAIRCEDDLAAIPLLTKDIIRERYRDLIAPGTEGKNIIKGTGGSTGTPLKFEYSLESEAWRSATRVRGYSWAGYRPGMRALYYWGIRKAHQRDPIKVQLDRALKRETFVDSIRQDEASRMSALELFRKVRPDVIVCYTQACAQFARWILDRGWRDWDDVPVICGAEAVLAGDRAVLSKTFGPVFETYGARETMLMAAECEAHDGMHIAEENIFFELVAENSQTHAAAGERGEVVVTDLHNFAMPMIRYVNGDLATMSNERSCACGRTLRKLARVEGRRSDTMHDARGNPVPGILLHYLFHNQSELVRQFQATQKVTGEVILKIVPGHNWSETGFLGIVSQLRERLGNLPVVTELCDAIEPGPNGKLRTVLVETAS